MCTMQARRDFGRVALLLAALVMIAVVPLSTGIPLAQDSDSINFHVALSAEDKSNDLVDVLSGLSGIKVTQHPNASAAVNGADEGEAVLVLSSTYPSSPIDLTSSDAAAWLKSAADKALSVFVEFVDKLPSEAGKHEQTSLQRMDADQEAIPAIRDRNSPQLLTTNKERAVVTSDGFVNAEPAPLQPDRIMHPHTISLTQPKVEDSSMIVDLVTAKVAGYDTLADGLPKTVFPLLMHRDLGSKGGVLFLSTTRLSRFRAQRFGPTAAWQSVFWTMLSNMTSSQRQQPFPSFSYNASVQTTFPREHAVTDQDRMQAFQRAVLWYRKSGLLPGVQKTMLGARLHAQGKAGPVLINITEPPSDGQFGVFEGFNGQLLLSGNQTTGIDLRADCIAETSMAFAVFESVTSSEACKRHGAHGWCTLHADGSFDPTRVATNLLDYAWIRSGFTQTWMPGTQGGLGDAMGLIGWASGTKTSAAEFYKDDTARGMLGGLATVGLLKSSQWNSVIAAAVLGNLRITGVDGFGPSSGTFQDIESNGWQSYFNGNFSSDPGNYSPHYQSYIWAVFLWACHHLDYSPLCQRAQAAIQSMMTFYPSRWQPTSNGITMQRARMLLPLAFLIRVNDTALHRQWLTTIADGLLARQQDCGAFMEEVSAPGWAAAARVPNNDDYGTFEAPLNQENTDPVSDLLYTSNFALLGLHEAAAATGNITLKKAADRLADLLVKAQAQSTDHPELDGSYARGFDFDKWETWASDADVGWGAWSVETGWTQSWISATLGFRLLNTTLWDIISSGVDIRQEFSDLLPFFFPPPPPVQCMDRPSNISNFTFVIETTDTSLCAQGVGSPPSHVKYTGSACGKNMTEILWQGMVTLDPRPGEPPSDCHWSARDEPTSWQNQYTGSCGVPPSELPDLPARFCN